MENENNIIKRNFRFLEKLEKLIIKESNLEDKFKLMDIYANFAANNPSGTLHSPKLEYHLLDFAESIPFKPSNKNKNKRLIVMSEAYKSGGHTRVVEHIINYSENNTYDLLFTWNRLDVPNSLLEICKNKECSIIFLSEGKVLEKAKQLRDIASGYNKIILFNHPEDYLPVLVFGHSKWNIPIFLYNHAEHRFWFGISIVDVVLDLSSRAKANSIKYRKAQKSEVVGIPIVSSEKDDRINDNIRQQLNINKNAIVFFSGGSPHKYEPIEELDFRNVVDMILSNTNNSYFLIIGIHPDSNEWSKLKVKFQNRLILMDVLEYRKYLEYLNIADIYVDSMPTSGFTMLLENAMRKIPIIFLDTHMSYPDCILKEAISITDKNNIYDKILEKAMEIINNGFKQELNLEECNINIENFLYNYNNILNGNITHNRNLNVKRVVDFSEDSFMRYVLKYFYKDRTDPSISSIGLLFAKRFWKNSRE
jgi:hypothetical protein